MNRAIEVSPLGTVEAAVETWPDLGHPVESPQRELYPNPFDGTMMLHHPGDLVRWDEVHLADGIAFRKITLTFAAGGMTIGMLAVYGRVVSDKYPKNGREAVRVDPVPLWKMSGVQETVLASYSGYLRRLGLSVKSVEHAVRQVVFMTDDGWSLGEEVGED